MADYGKIIQVFVNLIGNSMKFTETGSITVDIRSKIMKKGKPNFIECSIIDTGIGVSEEGRHQAVQGVLRGCQAKVQHKAGKLRDRLGLSITKKIVELHGGKIGYEPVEGGGSRFWFTLPIKVRRQKDVIGPFYHLLLFRPLKCLQMPYTSSQWHNPYLSLK